MARIPKCRRVESYPMVTNFKPAGIPRSRLKRTALLVEELEAIRLKDLLGLEQEDCAQKMNVSRPTFQRILVEARAKVADALINGKELHIEGGEYCLGSGPCRRRFRGGERSQSCPFLEQLEGVEERGDGDSLAGRIAICSSGDKAESRVDGHFGRCSHFMIYDPQNGEFESLANDEKGSDQGAGTGAAQRLIDKQVRTVVANRIGPKAFAVLQRAGIEVYEGAGEMDISSVLRKLEAGELSQLKQANHQ